jgi:pimeloyl-ACP methyl ester carboxylesterase
VVEAAAFFADVALRLLGGASVLDAVDEATSRAGGTLGEWVGEAKALLGRPAVEAIEELGQTCHVPEAFPATVYLLLRRPDDLEEALIENVMAGGDSAARGMLLGMALGAARGTASLSRWTSGLEAGPEIARLLGEGGAGRPEGGKLVFENAAGEELAGRLEMPAEDVEVRGYALFAHCFTCSKDIAAATRISRGLARRGIAVLRFDFTGLGNSDGDFANTSFSSNVQDLVSAAEHLRAVAEGPAVLVGHSLGGAAVLAAARALEEVRGVVTIGAPADPGHVEHLLTDATAEIEATGEAEVALAGRRFRIRRQFLDDIRAQGEHLERLADLRAALLVMHSPRDETVGVDNARRIFTAAKHPKSFVSLDPADHLLSKREDSEYVAEIVSAWASRLLG